MTDFFIAEEIQKMLKAIPKPRLLFKKGVTVTGYFRPYMSLNDYTKANIFKTPDEVTPVTVRFSSMLGDKGTADTRRNIKSMAVKFQSHDEIYDMICQNIPVSMTNDLNLMEELLAVFKTRDYFDGIDKEKLWKFIAKHSESILFAMMLYSEMGIRDNFVNINMFSVNTYLWLNNDSYTHFVRYKWVPFANINQKNIERDKLITTNAAEFMAGYDPDRAVNQLINDILKGEYPTFELHVQLLNGDKTTHNRYIDSTLLWPEKDAPYMCIGIMVLNNVDETTIDDESLYFFPSNTVEGIGLYMDELTQIMDFLFRCEAIERGVYI